MHLTRMKADVQREWYRFHRDARNRTTFEVPTVKYVYIVPIACGDVFMVNGDQLNLTHLIDLERLLVIVKVPNDKLLLCRVHDNVSTDIVLARAAIPFVHPLIDSDSVYRSCLMKFEFVAVFGAKFPYVEVIVFGDIQLFVIENRERDISVIGGA